MALHEKGVAAGEVTKGATADGGHVLCPPAWLRSSLAIEGGGQCALVSERTTPIDKAEIQAMLGDTNDSHTRNSTKIDLPTATRTTNDQHHQLHIALPDPESIYIPLNIRKDVCRSDHRHVSSAPNCPALRMILTIPQFQEEEVRCWYALTFLCARME